MDGLIDETDHRLSIERSHGSALKVCTLRFVLRRSRCRFLFGRGLRGCGGLLLFGKLSFYARVLSRYGFGPVLGFDQSLSQGQPVRGAPGARGNLTIPRARCLLKFRVERSVIAIDRLERNPTDKIGAVEYGGVALHLAAVEMLRHEAFLIVAHATRGGRGGGFDRLLRGRGLAGLTRAEAGECRLHSLEPRHLLLQLRQDRFCISRPSMRIRQLVPSLDGSIHLLHVLPVIRGCLVQTHGRIKYFAIEDALILHQLRTIEILGDLSGLVLGKGKRSCGTERHADEHHDYPLTVPSLSQSHSPF